MKSFLTKIKIDSASYDFADEYVEMNLKYFLKATEKFINTWCSDKWYRFI